MLSQYKTAALSQLLRIIRPARLPAPPPRLDAAELLGMLAEQSARGGPRSPTNACPKRPSQPQHPRADAGRERAPEESWPTPSARPATSRTTLQANPLVVAVACAHRRLVIVASDRFAVDRLQVIVSQAADAPTARRRYVRSHLAQYPPVHRDHQHGDNFDGKGEARIEIRAVHDGTWAYFLFTWDDPTRSLKHLPLIKEADGWHMLHTGYENGDEREFNEDKFSVLFTRADVTIAGDRTFHASPQPLADKPATMTGRGLHYTAEGSARSTSGCGRRPAAVRPAGSMTVISARPCRRRRGRRQMSRPTRAATRPPGKSNYPTISIGTGGRGGCHHRPAPPARDPAS